MSNLRVRTVTTIVSSKNPAVLNDRVTLTARVSAVDSTRVPDGLVTFRLLSFGGEMTAPLVNGVASITIPLLLRGEFAIQANYNAPRIMRGRFLDSNATIIQIVVGSAQELRPQITVTASEITAEFGEPITYTIVVSPENSTSAIAPQPTGTVTLSIDGEETQPIPLINGQATFTTDELPAGRVTVEAIYNGDQNYSAVESDDLIQTVIEAETITTITSSQNPSLAGELVTFTFRVSRNPPDDEIPTGSITLNINDGDIDDPILLDEFGMATYESTFGAGEYQIQATYNGDDNFDDNTSDIFTQIVTPGSDIGIIDGNNQITIVETSFEFPLIIRVINNQSNPVAGVPVTFNAPSSGPSLIFSNGTNSETQITDQNGFATSSLPIANSIAGSYNVSVTAPNQLPTRFNLTNVPVPCLAADTRILMSDGSLKTIQSIKRGDFVVGDLLGKTVYKVARVTSRIITDECPVDLVVFESGSMGKDIPSQQLIITGNHALIYDGARRPAKCFADNPQITRYYRGKIYKDGNFVENGKVYYLKDLLPSDHHVYDLQFETVGSYVAEGIVVQSRCPRSNLTPLPKELYFNQSLYTPKVMIDNPDEKLPLDLKTVKLH